MLPNYASKNLTAKALLVIAKFFCLHKPFLSQDMVHAVLAKKFLPYEYRNLRRKR